MHRAIDRPFPYGLAAWRVGWHLQPVLHEPHQRLAYAAQFGKLTEDEKNSLLDAQIRILLQSLVFALDVADGSGNDQFATACLFSACLDRALTQQVQFILVQTALEAQQQTVVAKPWRVDHLLINQHGIDHATDFHQLLPLATVARKTGDLAGRDRTHLPEADLRDHALKSSPHDQPGGGPPQVFIHNFDLTPPQLSQPRFHRILQLLALQVMEHLVRRRLTNIKDGLALQMLGANLLTHRPPPPAR